MSDPFTINAENWQLKCEELRLAYSERLIMLSPVIDGPKRYVLDEEDGTYKWKDGDGSTDDALVGGEVVQSVEFFRTMQEIAEKSHNLYDDRIELPAVIGSDSEWDDYRVEDFFEYAGGSLYDEETESGGYRRCVEIDPIDGPVFLRGYMEEGDIIGQWVFEDLVAAFSAIRLVISGAFKCYKSESAGTGGSIGSETVPYGPPDDKGYYVDILLDQKTQEASEATTENVVVGEEYEAESGKFYYSDIQRAVETSALPDDATETFYVEWDISYTTSVSSVDLELTDLEFSDPESSDFENALVLNSRVYAYATSSNSSVGVPLGLETAPYDFIYFGDINEGNQRLGYGHADASENDVYALSDRLGDDWVNAFFRCIKTCNFTNA